MGKYDILVSDAEFKLSMAKRNKSILEKKHEKAWLKVIDAENKLSDIETKLLNVEKYIRSLAAKLREAKKNNI